MSSRKQYNGHFKAQVAIEAIKNQRTKVGGDEVKYPAFFAIVMLVAFSLGNVRANLKDDLVVYFSFDDEEAKDLSGTGNDGGVVGGKWISGPKPEFGKAIEFDGVGDHIVVADNNSLDVGKGDISISLWISYNVDDQPNPYPRLISNGMPLFGGNGPGFEITVKGNVDDAGHPLGIFYGMSGNGPPPRQTVDGKLEEIGDGEWYHVVALKEGEEGRAYVNGGLTGIGPLVSIDITNDLPLVIGASGAIGQFYKGAVDDVAVFMRALADEEIKALSQTPLSIASSVEPEGKLPVTWGHIRRAY